MRSLSTNGLLISIFVITCHTGCATAQSVPRYVVCMGEKDDKTCGAINELGEVKVAFQKWSKRAISHFDNGLSRTIIDGKEGLIDTDATVVIPPNYSQLSTPSEGLIVFRQSEGGKCGFLELDETVAIEPSWDGCFAFRFGRAKVYNVAGEGDRLFGFLNSEGDLAIDLVFEVASSFFESRALVKLSPNAGPELIEKLGSKLGYVDRDGNPVTKFEFDKADQFSNGMAMVARKVGEHAYDDEYSQGVEDIFAYGFINLEGELVWPMEFRWAEDFNEAGFAKVDICDEDDECKAGIIDKDGGWKFRPETYEYIASFSEGLAFVETHEGWKGYVDEHGEKVFEASNGTPFVNGVADVKFWFDDELDACGSSGLVDTKGEYIFPFRVVGAFTVDRSFDENQIMVADIFAKGTDYHELVLHRERGVIWPPGWNEPGAGEGVLCWPELEAKKKGASPSELEGE